MPRIDVYTHLVPARWDDWAARCGGGNWPRLQAREGCRATLFTGAQFFRDIDDRSWSAARCLEDMDRLRIDVQALSPPPVMFCYWAEAEAAQAFARMQNVNVAEELRHARERLDLRAVEIGTCPGGRDFDDPALFEFFAACVDLVVAVFVHPATPLVGLDRMKKHYFPLIVGNPLETARWRSPRSSSPASSNACRGCASASPTAAMHSRSRWRDSITAGPCDPKGRRRFRTSRVTTPGGSGWTRSRSARRTCASSSTSSGWTASSSAATIRSTWRRRSGGRRRGRRSAAAGARRHPGGRERRTLPRSVGRMSIDANARRLAAHIENIPVS